MLLLRNICIASRVCLVCLCVHVCACECGVSGGSVHVSECGVCVGNACVCGRGCECGSVCGGCVHMSACE